MEKSPWNYHHNLRARSEIKINENNKYYSNGIFLWNSTPIIVIKYDIPVYSNYDYIKQFILQCEPDTYSYKLILTKDFICSNVFDCVSWIKSLWWKIDVLILNFSKSHHFAISFWYQIKTYNANSNCTVMICKFYDIKFIITYCFDMKIKINKITIFYLI